MKKLQLFDTEGGNLLASIGLVFAGQRVDASELPEPVTYPRRAKWAVITEDGQVVDQGPVRAFTAAELRGRRLNDAEFDEACTAIAAAVQALWRARFLDPAGRQTPNLIGQLRLLGVSAEHVERVYECIHEAHLHQAPTPGQAH